jgi:soluble lytic murein transglycosylase-like protein
VLAASAVAFAFGASSAVQAEIKINRHGMNMAAPQQSYDVILVKGIRIQRMRPVVSEKALARKSLSRPSSDAAVPMKRLLHPELVLSAAAQIGERYDKILRKLATEHLPNILGASRRHGVPADFIMAVIAVESGGQIDALSPKGAQGLMQLMPATAIDLDVDDAFDPTQNIDGGTRLLSRLLDRYGGDPVLTLAAYNAGEQAVTDHNGVPPYEETRDYIPRVLGAIAAAQRTVSDQ